MMPNIWFYVSVKSQTFCGLFLILENIIPLLQTVKSLELCLLRVEMSEPKEIKLVHNFLCGAVCLLCIFVGVGYTGFCSNNSIYLFPQEWTFFALFCSWGLNNLLYGSEIIIKKVIQMFHKEVISKAIKHTI